MARASLLHPSRRARCLGERRALLEERQKRVRARRDPLCCEAVEDVVAVPSELDDAGPRRERQPRHWHQVRRSRSGRGLPPSVASEKQSLGWASVRESPLSTD